MSVARKLMFKPVFVAPPVVSFVAASPDVTSVTTGNTQSTTVPSGVILNDLMLIFLCGNGANTVTVTEPSGWNRAINGNGTYLTTTAGNYAIFWKFAGASEPGTVYTATWSTSVRSVMEVTVYRGVSAATPFDSASTMVAETSSSATHIAPSISLASSKYVVQGAATKDTANSAWTVPGGITRRTQAYGGAGSGNTSLVSGDLGLTSGTVPAASFTTNSTANANAAMWTLGLTAG